jgi:hypothetical protein
MDKETELAKIVIDWLKDQKWEVWQEVKLSKYICPIHDIIAVQNGITWCIECKLNFNLKVIEQVYRSNTIFKSIAVPKMNCFGNKICNILGIGVIHTNNNIFHYYPGKVFRENYRCNKEIVETLKNIPQSYSEAGSFRGHYWSPYKETITNVKNYINKNPCCKLKDIMDGLKHHYASAASARSCLKKSLEEYETNWCDIKDGRYYIKGKNE